MLPFRVIPAHHPRPAASPRYLCSLGVSALDPSSLLSFGLRRHSPLTAVFLPFPFSRLRTLSFSVSCKSCVCHSYENCRVCTNNSHSGTHCSPFSTRHCTQVLSFHTLAHSFAHTKITTLFFSSNSALFAQNNRGWGLPSLTFPPTIEDPDLVGTVNLLPRVTRRGSPVTSLAFLHPIR